MGQKTNLQQFPAFITFSMCENSRTTEMLSVSTDDSDNNPEEIVTVSLLNNNEDVDLLKARLNESSLSPVETNNVDTHECISSLILDPSCENASTAENDGVSTNNSESGNGITETPDGCESLCQSTETLIDQIQSSDSVCNTEAGSINGHLKVTEIKERTQSLPIPPTASCNGNTTAIVTSVHSGLLISSGPLTQDMPVNMASDNKRMSSVLESLDLHLLYLPTTKQLVAARKTQPIDSGSVDNTSNSKHGINICNSDDSSGVTEHCTDKELNDTLTTPTKMSTNHDISPMQSGTILTPGSLDDSSSICETDFLIKIKEPDQLTCDSSEYECNFPRINTNESLLRTFTDASSLSSISTSTDFSISAASLEDGEGTGLCIDTGDAGFMEISLHSRNSFERTKNPSQDSGFEDRSAKPKRKGLSGFLSRNIFSRKSKEPNSDSEDSEQGWKLFGKIPPKLVPTKDPEQVLSEYQAKQRSEKLPTNRAKKEDIEVMSTTALILENRPMNLPNKDPDEAEKHKQQYDAMVEAARRKEQKEMKQKKKQKQQQLRQEDQLLAQARVWTRDILPHWDSMRNGKKARDLWWHGIPTNVRGRVWKLALGNDLNITQELYEICVSRAEDKIKQMDESSEVYGTSDTSSVHSHSKESSVELIKLDVSRTFPQLCIFQKGGPYHDLLHSLLGAYACYRPDVGYVQGMSFIAAVLLLNMEVADAFICFTNLLNNPCQVAFFRVDESLMKSYFLTYEEFFTHNLPSLQKYFAKHTLTPDLYLYDWIFTLFTKAFPLDLACHIWDIFCRDGEEFLFRTAIGILKLFEDVLMTMDFIHLAQFLTKLPDNISQQNLFRCIETIQMTIDKRKFSQVLASHRDSKDNT